MSTQVEAAYEQYRLGKITLDRFLEAQVALADSIRDEGTAVVQYNQSLIQWEFAKGTILLHDNVVVADSSRRVANRELIEERRRTWAQSMPMPIWAGSRVHADFLPCPTPDGPIYTDLTGSAGTVKETAPFDPAGVLEKQELTRPPEEIGLP